MGRTNLCWTCPVCGFENLACLEPWEGEDERNWAADAVIERMCDSCGTWCELAFNVTVKPLYASGEAVDAIRFHLSGLIRNLVDGRLESVVATGGLEPPIAEEVQAAIDGYPGKITMPPPHAFEQPEVRQVERAAIPTYHFDFHLWFDGRCSTLNLRCTAVVQDVAHVQLLIDDAYVI